jgi:hypothetical protein
MRNGIFAATVFTTSRHSAGEGCQNRMLMKQQTTAKGR